MASMKSVLYQSKDDQSTCALNVFFMLKFKCLNAHHEQKVGIDFFLRTFVNKQSHGENRAEKVFHSISQ
jgi:hypothetical protein